MQRSNSAMGSYRITDMHGFTRTRQHEHTIYNICTDDRNRWGLYFGICCPLLKMINNKNNSSFIFHLMWDWNGTRCRMKKQRNKICMWCSMKFWHYHAQTKISKNKHHHGVDGHILFVTSMWESNTVMPSICSCICLWPYPSFSGPCPPPPPSMVISWLLQYKAWNAIWW